MSRRDNRSRTGPQTLFNFPRSGNRQWISIKFHVCSRYLTATRDVHSTTTGCKWLIFRFTTMMQRNQSAHTAWLQIFSRERNQLTTSCVMCQSQVRNFCFAMETSASYFFDRAESFCFLPLVKILNFGLQNELQNTRGRQSKNSLSHFQSTWSKNLRDIFFDIFCNLSVHRWKIGPPK